MSKEFKVIESKVQPNHKEAEIWMTPADKDGTREIKHYNNVSQEWEGGSGSGSGEGDNETLYYKLEEPLSMWDVSDIFYNEENLFSRARGSINNTTYFYGTVSSLNLLFGLKYSSKPVIDAFEFKPIQLCESFSNTSVITYKDYETLCANIPEICPPATRITAEEYWQYFNAE